MLSEGLLFVQIPYVKIKWIWALKQGYMKIKARTRDALAFNLAYFKYSLIASLNISILLK